MAFHLLRSLLRSKPAVRLTVMAMAGGMLVAPAVVTTAGVAQAQVTNPASLVNTFIGTTNGGDDFPGPDMPFGMIQWGPDTNSRDSGSGYDYTNTTLIGYSLNHLSGPGCGAEGDSPILPTVGSPNISETETFSHSNESASAGYYSLKAGNGVQTQLTTTDRTGIAEFTFPSTTQANLIFKLGDSENTDDASSFNVVSNTEVTGSVSSGHFCGAGNTYTIYFDMQFGQPFSTNGTFASGAIALGARHLLVKAGAAATPATVSPKTPEKPNHPVYHGDLPKGQTAAPAISGPNGAYVTFNTTSNQTVQAKVGISYVSVANASANLAAEQSGFNFSGVESANQSAWNSMLGKIGITGGTSSQQAVFYTALYHALLHPNINSDDNGQYTGVDGAVHQVDAGHQAEYTNFSGWDIYRSQAQLEGLIAPQQASDTAQSMVDDYAQEGMLPKWMEDNGESYVMVGDPADAILADYYAFGGTNFDTSAALQDMIAEGTNVNNIRPGLNYLNSPGYLPSDGSYGCCNFYGPVSTTLEYDSADFAISAFAGELGDTTDQQAFVNRAQDWKKLLNPANGFMQGRDMNGSFVSGFNPTAGSSDFVEGTSWMYTGMVPFNVAGLISAKGGDASMISFLNSDLGNGFLGGGGQSDFTNEPSLYLPWEYDYAGEPYQAQNVVREIQNQIWQDAPTGLAGNDDLGEMSAWYVWSALGMYPETPGTSTLALNSPEFTQAVVTLPSGSTLTINGNGAATNAPYVQSATWNGSAWNNAYTPSGWLTSGGTLTYTLGTSPNTSWASSSSEAPPSFAGNGGPGPGPGTGYNNNGITNDTNRSGGDFDGGSYSYSAQALAAAGVTPGSTVTANGINFTWPNVPAGAPDNYVADGQTIKVSGSGSISFLGAATNGPSSGTATITYTDGSTQNVTLSFSDWTLNGGSATVESGNTIAITTPYRNNGAGKDSITTDVFATTPVSLASGKTVASVTLPASANQGLLHVFAIGTSTSSPPPVSFNNTGIVNDGSSGGNFDGGGNSYSAQALAAAGVTPGSTIAANGLAFTWPDVAAGSADNYQAAGQTILISGSGSISFLGAATNGPSSGTATITYTDGSTQNVTLSFSDWTLNGGSATVESGNTIAAKAAYRDNSTGGKDTTTTDVFATTPVTLASGKTVASVTLPSSVTTGALHVFAIATGNPASYNNTGISNDGTASSANFDGDGYSYSAQALATAGVTPGSTVTSGTTSFTWPGVAVLQPDNYQAAGQTILISGSGSISFLGAATNGPSSGTATITYTDGSTQQVTIAFSDWTLNGGSATVESGNSVAISTPHRNTSSGSADNTVTDVFATTPVALASGKTVASITLPSTVTAGALHIFAISIH